MHGSFSKIIHKLHYGFQKVSYIRSYQFLKFLCWVQLFYGLEDKVHLMNTF